MAENLKQQKIELKRIGIYVVILLALIRFLIYPLQASLQEKKALLGEWYENYRIKSQVLERQREGQGIKVAVGKSVLLSALYDKGVPNSYIQSDLLEWVTKIAEQNGLTIINFEMVEPFVGKGVSEVPILIRLKGLPRPFMGTLEAIGKGKRALKIRSMEITKSGKEQLYSLTISAFRVEI